MLLLMKRKEWIPKISIIITIILLFVWIIFPDWIFKNDFMFVVFCAFCLISAIVGYKLNERIKRENTGKEK